MTDAIYMKRALALAEEAAAAGEVPVGALLVDPSTGTICAEGANRPVAAHDPTAHAEIVAIRQAAAKLGNYRLPGLHLYVTLEPCTMCAAAISFARLSRLVFAATDDKGGAVVSGVRFFDQATCHWRPEIYHYDTYADEAGDLLRAFFKERRKLSQKYRET